MRRGVVEKVHNEGAAYTLVEDGTGVRWQHHPARSLKARTGAAKTVAPPPPPAADVNTVLSLLTPAQRQRFVDNEVTLECLALLNDEDLDDLLEGDAEAKASFRLRYPPPTTDDARGPVRFEVSDEASPPPAPPPAPPTPLPPEAPPPTKIPERPLLRVVVDACVEIKFWAPHAIDATLSPWPRRLDGVEVHKGLRNNSQDNLLHWLISTQACTQDASASASTGFFRALLGSSPLRVA